MENNIIVNKEEEKSTKNFQNSFLLKKTKRNYILSDTEIIDESNKISLLKKISNFRKNSCINEKIQKYNKFLSYLDKNINGDLDINIFNELLGVDNITNPILLKKESSGFLISYYREKYYTLFFYRIPKLIGKLKYLNNLNIYLCFTNRQLDESLKNRNNYDYEAFSFNDSNIVESNCFYNDQKLRNANELLFIFNNKINFDLNSLKKSDLLIKIDEEKRKIDPLLINLGFFYYIDDVLPKYQNGYKFIISEKRKAFISNIIDFVNHPFNKYYYMTGPKCIGKTTTLLYFSGLNLYNKFYFNFKSFFKQSKKNTKKMMKYEIMKLLIFLI